MIAWFARNHVAANLLMAGIIVVGAWSLSYKIPLEVFPSIELDIVNISTVSPGTTPEDVEESVTVRIEEAIEGMRGVREIRSRSEENLSRISVEVEKGYDPRRIIDDLRARVDAISGFPADIEWPSITQVIGRSDVISVVIGGDLSERELRTLGQRVRDDLLALPAITEVDLVAVRDPEIAIEVSESDLREYRLSLAEIANAVRSGSLNISAGNLRTAGGEILLRTRGQAYTPADFERIVVQSRIDGGQLTLGDIATVRDSFDESRINTRFNGRPAVVLDVYRVGQQSAIEVAQAVRDYIDNASWLPSGVEMKYWGDRSKIVKARLNTLLTNALQGGFLVVFLLALFLRPGVAFWVSLGIPISFIGSFIVLSLLGVTINIVTLFAFITVLGIVVDDAIVTGENIYTHINRGKPALQAAIDGTHEVALPVTFGILTTIAAFVPLALVGGYRGAIWAQIPAVVIPVLIFSWIESKLVLPAHLKYIRPRQQMTVGLIGRLQQSVADSLEYIIRHVYEPVLAVCLRYRYATLAVFSVCLMVAVAIIDSGTLRFVFFPRVQSETARASLLMPAGTPFEVTDAHIVRMAEAAATLRDKYIDGDTQQSIIKDILATSGSAGNTGSGSSNRGRVVFEIVAPEHRTLTVTSAELVREWRQLIGPISGAEEVSYRAEIGRGGDPIDVQFTGNNIQLMSLLAQKTEQQLASYPDVYDISDSFSAGKQEAEVVLKPQSNLLGVTLDNLAQQVRYAFYGLEVQRLQRGRDDTKVVLRYPDSERQSLGRLEQMMIRTPAGREVPFYEVATVTLHQGAAVLYRIDGKRTINVTADANKDSADIEAIKRDLALFLNDLLTAYPEIKWSFEGEDKEGRETIGSIFSGGLVILFVVYALLAIPFRSYVQPLIIMSIIPFGFIGVVFGHLLMGLNLSFASLFGLLALCGVVVNDSLVLVDYSNRRRRTGAALLDAVQSAGGARFRAIILTSLTTFAGLMPLLLDKTTQAQFLIPMSVSLGFGILFATPIMLVLVPANYLILEDIRRMLRCLLHILKQLYRMVYPVNT